MLEHLKDLHAQALEELNRIDNPRELELWRVQYLGKKSSLTQSLRSLAALPLEERRRVGAEANEVKTALESSLAEKQRLLQEVILSSHRQSGGLDVTLPGRPLPTGRTHPTTQILKEICDVFRSMGFQVIEGPDVEWDYYNFEALNIPAEHPARDTMSTSWVATEKGSGERQPLLRTHTTSVTARTLESMKPPIRAV